MARREPERTSKRRRPNKVIRRLSSQGLALAAHHGVIALLLGMLNRGRILAISHALRGKRSESSVVDGLGAENDENMKKATKSGEMRPYYDFSAGVRGKYAAAYARGTNVVVIEPDLAKIFPNSEAVNDALRTLVRAASKSVHPPQ
jgi:hypothetical protein